MPTLTLFEHECTSGLACGRPELEALEELQQRLGVDLLRVCFRRGRCELKANQYVGVFRLGELTVQILPKMYRATPDMDPRRRVRRATRNLLGLLEGAGCVPVYQPGVGPLLRQRQDWFEVLTALFAVQLQRAWQSGPLRGYQPTEEEGPTLRGRWRLLEQFRRPARQHVFAFSHDDFTCDNPINRLLRFTVERLWERSTDASNRHLLGEVRQLMEEVTLLPRLTPADLEPPAPPAWQERLQPLLELARLFLAGGTLQLAEGEVATFALLFDMNRIFESFLLRFVVRHRRALLSPALREAEFVPWTQGASLTLARTNDQPVFQLRPDLVVRQGDQTPLIVDAKYRLLDADSIRLGVAADDFYQMLAYARRYRCPRVVLLYPQTAGLERPLQQVFTLEGPQDATVLAATVDLRGNLSSVRGRRVLGKRLRALLGLAGAEPG